MASFRCIEFLPLLLLLNQVYGEEPEPSFRAKGSVIEMGYCFGVDYIVVYRSAPGGDQLLGNSSAPITPPADLQDRIHVNRRHDLLGLQISDLTHMDSGIYRRECWQNQTLVSQHTQQLSVCDEEVESVEIIVKEGAEGAQLLCNSTSTGLEGTSVRWYYEMYPSYKITLLLDSYVSLEPVVKEMQGVVEVKNRGALLMVDSNVLQNVQHFHCLVVKGKNCLSFQNLYLPEQIDSRDIFASQGDRVVLNCPSSGNNQHWDTPLGKINGSSRRDNQMSVSVGEDFSLVIPAVTEEHIGDYTCMSTSLELQYLLVLCPTKTPQEKSGVEGKHVSLECKVGQDTSQRVQWYREETSGEHELIRDSNDETVPIPKDLRGRLTLSDSNYSLTISNLRKTDERLYWCVVLRGTEFPEGDYEDYNDYDKEDTEDDEVTDDEYWQDANGCIFKQETNLTFPKKRSGGNLEPVTSVPVSRTPENNNTANTAAYAVGGAVVGLLVVGVILAVIVIKKKKATSRSGLNTNNDITMKEDPSCTKRLTNDEDNI